MQEDLYHDEQSHWRRAILMFHRPIRRVANRFRDMVRHSATILFLRRPI